GLVPSGRAVFLGGKLFDAVAFCRRPYCFLHMPMRLVAKSRDNSLDENVYIEFDAEQFLDAGQGRRERALGQQQGAVLQQGLMTFTLRAAEEFVAIVNEIAGRLPMEAEDILTGGPVAAGRWLNSAKLQAAQGGGDDLMHIAHP